jgi:uncharacterized protein
MSIRDELRAELKDAMRGRDQRRLDVIRLVETELSMAKTAPGFKGEIDDALYVQVIHAYVKKMDKARQGYETFGERGKEMADKLAFEIAYLSRWLPHKLSEQETRELIRQTIAELGITDPKQSGRLVGHLMKARGSDLDGALASRLAKEALQEK